MANRQLLHKSKIEEFKSWLLKNGWSIQPSKDYYEVLRATTSNPKRVIIIYTTLKDPKEHYIIRDVDRDIVTLFVRDSKHR